MQSEKDRSSGFPIQPTLLDSPPESEYWRAVRDANRDAFVLFTRHYTYRHSDKRKAAGRKFVGPGAYIVLLSPQNDALFVWRKFRPMDGQLGVNCAAFRNESDHRSSDMIRDAETWAWARWPGLRLWTYVNPRKVKSRNPGYCFKAAGWRFCGLTSRGLHILEKLPIQVEPNPQSAIRNPKSAMLLEVPT